jgi:hypothetical protein
MVMAFWFHLALDGMWIIPETKRTCVGHDRK